MDDTSTSLPRHGRAVAVAAALLGLGVAWWLSAHDLINVYGDGVAHLNIARKVVDAAPGTSLWTHYVQLGSPWLPVQHVLMLPFVWIDGLWRSGWAGTIPSLACYVVAVWCTHRLAYDLFDDAGEAREHVALLSAVCVGLNPSVLYLAAAPMTEVPFLAILVACSWTLLRWSRDGRVASLVIAAVCVAVATLTRYEGWALVPAGALVVVVCARGPLVDRARAGAIWTGVAALGILYWLWHNHAIAGDPLEFVRGPYSARAVFERANLGWAAVSVGQPVKSVGWALVTLAVVAGPLLVALGAAGGIARAISRGRDLARDLPAWLVAVPFAFLVFSLFRGEVQIAPFAAVALLNVRYGVPHVAALALLVGALAVRLSGRRAAVPVLLALVIGQNVWLLGEGFSQVAVCQEAIRNSRNSSEWRERDDVAVWLAAHPPAGRTLLHSGDLGPVVPRSGLTFSRIIHDGSQAWGEWVATRRLPGDVTTVVARRGDEVLTRLSDDPEFSANFVESFATGPFVVFSRN